VFIAVVWVIQEFTSFHVLKYVILFIGVMNSLFSVYDIYDDLISRRVNTSDAEKFAEICPCPCNGFAWGVIWSAPNFNSYFVLCTLMLYIKIILMVKTQMLTFAVLSFFLSGYSSRLSFSALQYTLDWSYCLEDSNLAHAILI